MPVWWREKQARLFPPHKHLYASELSVRSRAGCDSRPANGNELKGWKEECVLLGNCCPSVLPTHKRDGEFEEFAKRYVIPTQRREEDKPAITQAEAAAADERCTVCIHIGRVLSSFITLN